jgi:nucleotide-binding universal stress UspA family protein
MGDISQFALVCRLPYCCLMNKRIQTILVPTDFSDNAQAAFDYALRLAQQLSADLHVLHVQDESTLRLAVKEGLLETGTTDEQLQTATDQLIAMRFSALLAGTGASGVNLAQARRRGHAHLETIEYAKEIDADLLVIGRRGLSAMTTIASALLGSVAERLLKHSPIPVLVVRLPDTDAE